MATDFIYFRERLFQMKRDLEDQSRTAASSRRPVELDQQSVGRLSRQDALQHQAMALAQENRRLTELPRIDAALARITDGTFGICAECEEEIPDARLRVDPTILICVTCREI